MDLLDYPRPINDTGIGVHWSAGISHVSLAQLRSFWIAELQALGVCWVKIADHRYALSLAEELLAVGIMPIVQIQRQDSRTLTFSNAEIEAVDALVAAGVRYFEPQYVAGSLRVPPLREAIHVVADRVVADLESILARGGLPALPPLAPQHHFDLLRLLIERGHLNLIRGPIWQALRNGGLNRPLNFPHDPGHRDGAPLTQEYYDALGHEDWRGDAWQGRELPWINNLRRQASQGSLPDTVKIPGDEECWLAYETIDAINQRLLGRSLPILSTAGGWVVGAKEDPRYPAVTPLLHLAQTLEACRVMMGTSRRYSPAPDAFFCTAFWLLANDAVESDRPAPEQEAWYSAVWPQQTLPIVPALKAEPKRTRLPFWTPARQTASAEKPVDVVSTPDGDVATVVGETSSVRAVANAATASMLSGHVHGGANAVLCLVRADGVLYRALAAGDGYFEFVDLARGRYTIWVEQPVGSRRENIELDGRNHVELKLTVDRWGHEVIPLEDVGPSLLRCRVESSLLTTEAGTLAIRVRRSDDSTGQSSRVVPLARRADGVAGCEITPLAGGEYRVEVLGVTGGDGEPFALEAQARIGGPTQIKFVFNRPFERGFLQFSVIYGQVVDGWGQQLVLTDAQGRQRNTEVDEQDRYTFDHLAPGLYSVALLGHEQTIARNRIGIDGKNQVQVNFTYSADKLSTQSSDGNLGLVELHLPEGAELDEDFRLVSVSGDFYTQAKVEAGQPVRFDAVPSGIYTLSGNGYWQPGVDVHARQVAVVTLPALSPAWTWRVDEQTVDEGGEGILIHVLGRGGLPIVVVNEEGETRVAATGSIEDAPFSAWVDQLPPTAYFVSPEGLDTEAVVILETGQRATVTFRRNGVSAGLSHISYRSHADPA